MRKIDYQQRISECSKKAETAPTEESRRIWRQMEEFWRENALQPKLPLRRLGELKGIGSPPIAPAG
jgi:hypothetical protein